MRNVLYYLQGYVRISIAGRQAERFINLCSYNDYTIWGLSYIDGNYECNMLLKDYRKLRGIIRKTHIKIRIREKRGLPFVLAGYTHRKAYFVGVFLFFAILFGCSRLLWDIEVDGNSHVTEEAMIEYLADSNIEGGSLKGSIDCAELEKSIRNDFEEIIWVSAEIKGARLLIRIKENLVAKVSEEAVVPGNIVAAYDATISKIVTRAGTPRVLEDSEVKQGDILVEGVVEIYNDSQELAGIHPVAADADVTGIYTISYEDAFKLKQQKIVFTGRQKKTMIYRKGSFRFVLPTLKKEFESGMTVTEKVSLAIGEFLTLPGELERETVLETVGKTFYYDENYAKVYLENQFLRYCEKLEQKGIQIMEKNVMIEKDAGACYARGSITVAGPVGEFRTMEEDSRKMSLAEIEMNMPTEHMANVFGQFDQYIKKLERAFHVTIVMRNDSMKIIGSQQNCESARKVFEQLIELSKRQQEITEQNVDYAIALAFEQNETQLVELDKDVICHTVAGKPVKPKTLGQKKYVDDIRNKMIVFGLGPAGTGKTYLAMAMAITAFKNEEVGRIILTRPAIEAGEKLGFLPGDLQSKVDPYLRPLYDALYQIMGAESFQKNMEKGLIEVAPLAYMRGRTLDNAFIILDEAQNTTPAQMKMFLTRIGFGSKVVITGDASQKDLAAGATSGLDVALKVLGKVDEIAFCKLTSQDVVRHPLVQKIVKAYEDFEAKESKSGNRKSEKRAANRTGSKR